MKGAKIFSLSDDDEVFVSVLTFYELEYGFENAPSTIQPLLRERIEKTKTDFSILALSLQSSHIFGMLKHLLKNHLGIQKKVMLKQHNIDIMLASTALHEECIFVSNDSIFSEFAHVEPSFRFERWFL